MNQQFINSFLSSFVDVMGTMTTLDVKLGKPVLKKDKSLSGVVTGLMDMSSPQADGAMAISFSDIAIYDLVKQLLDEDLNEINDVATDAVGEMTNMVTGSAKKLLADSGFDFDMSTPQVLKGKDQELNFPGVYINIPIELGGGKVDISLSFKKNKKPNFGNDVHYQ